MGSNLMNKLAGFLGIENADQDAEYDGINEEGYEEEREEYSPIPVNNKRNKIVGMPGVGMSSVRVVISQPNSYDQAQEICEHLKEKKSIILNLEYVNKDLARRIIDFMSGAVYALDGNIQKISNTIFLIAPYNYEITNELVKEDISKNNKTQVSWIK